MTNFITILVFFQGWWGIDVGDKIKTTQQTLSLHMIMIENIRWDKLWPITALHWSLLDLPLEYVEARPHRFK